MNGDFEELRVAHKKIVEAVYAEDLFGCAERENDDALRESIKTVWKNLSKKVHPDLYANNEEARKIAEEATIKLNSLYRLAVKEIKNKVYGKRNSERDMDEENESHEFIIKTKRAEYSISNAIAEGDLSVVYGGKVISGDKTGSQIAVKIIGDSVDNDLARSEIKILNLFQSESSPQNKHFPVLFDKFKTSDGQIGLILSHFDGYDLYSIRENQRYLKGIPQKHMVWMLNRLLSALGRAHQLGVVHGNIDPSHLMIRPKDHNLCLVDWSYAVKAGENFKVFNDDFGAPEIKEQGRVLPASDLYSVGKCMIYILGGDIKTNEMPTGIDERLQRFIKFFVRESQFQRARDAWEMHKILNDLVIELWGPKRFLEFKI